MHASFTVLRQAFASARQERRARHRDIARHLCAREGIGVLLAGPFNSGILATGVREGATFFYQPAERERAAAEAEKRGRSAPERSDDDQAGDLY